MRKNLEYAAVTQYWVKKLTQFFEDIATHKDDAYFHPHPFTYEMARMIANYEGNDLYFLQIQDDEIAGYAMLRGWDDGFTIPSLGIVIHPTFRNEDLGTGFMEFLHSKARAKGASKVRVKVYPTNVAARHLYEKLGYSFCDEENGQLIGYCEL